MQLSFSPPGSQANECQYYFAPVCAVMNGLVALFTEVPTMSMQNIYDVGFIVLVANAMIAFLLNVSVVFLVRSP